MAEYMKKFPADIRKDCEKAIAAVEEYLPKEKYSPWPRELRRVESRFDFTRLIAWDGTCGASVSFGNPMKPFLGHYTKRFAGLSGSQKKLFEAVADPDWLADVKKMSCENLKNKVSRYGFQLQTALKVEDRNIVLPTQDLLKLLHTTQSLKINEIGLSAINDINEDILVTFDVGTLLVHIIAKENDNEF